jgi:hypothetical protein
VFGGAGYYFDFPLPTCLLSAGLCSIAGMLPDIDSDTSRSFQECIYLAAGIAAVLFVQRLREFGFEHDIILLGGAAMFLFVRFGIGELVKKITSHRGMFHSIPAAVFSGQIVFFLSTGILEERIFKAVALSTGYLSHLILDEVCSVDSNGRLKKSFGTALKLFDTKRIPATLILYALIVCLGTAAAKNSENNGSEEQLALDKPNMTIKSKVNEIKGKIKTAIQLEAAEYLAQSGAVSPEPEPKSLVPLQVPRNDGRDSEQQMFSRNRRRTDSLPMIAAGLDTALPTQNQPPEPVSPPFLPMSTSSADFGVRSNYRNFALPNREPASITLP